MTGQNEVEVFAALLRRFKDRTDRSYGQLARRLNMNTSTLHRYCAGEAVPLDFAPAERFAALCGASPEERLELHRLWLSAVAARQRPRTGNGSRRTPAWASGETGAEDDPGAGEASAVRAGDGTDPERDAKGHAADGDGGVGPDDDGDAQGRADVSGERSAVAGLGAEAAAGLAAGAGTEPNVHGEPDTGVGSGTVGMPNREGEPDAGQGPNTEGGPQSESGPKADGGPYAGHAPNSEDRPHTAHEPAPADRTHTAHEPTPEHRPNAETGPELKGGPLEAGVAAPVSGPAARPWFRRRRALATAAVAAALLATLGSLSALPSGGPSGDDSARASGGPSRTTDPGTPHRPSGTPSKSSPGSPSPSPSASKTSSGPKAAKPSATPSGTGRRPSGAGGQNAAGAPAVPLTWTADSQIWNMGCGHDYVIDKPPAQVPPPPAAQDAAPWAATQGALHGQDTNVRISVQGRSTTAVVLEALRVRVVRRSDPAPGNSYAMDQGCGGALTPRFFSVDLDKDRPIAHSEAGGDEEGPIPAVEMPYRVSSEDPEVLLVTARTTTCDCSWYLELDWSSQGRTGTIRIDDHGSPFRTTSIKGLPRYWYGTNGSGERQWVPYDS
ncbi:helix-turn-helix domain-containing protein [Streptomyces cellulosae]|uniref:Helix-turn-helix domain-containing protein n=1 Tax=Streptomyces cellulosae TaxID=1968 RepID=A0ABW7YG52_STRCE